MTYTNREEWLNAAVEELRPIFDSINYALPDRIRVTCGFPSSRARANNAFIGEHWSPAASNDNHHEILISPVVDDPLQVFATLVHELAHAATDGDGHGSRFVRCVRSLWLEGKPTATVAGETFKQNFANLLDGLGAYPHARLNIEAVRKKQSTRMLKACCPSCGYTVRLTKYWADQGLPVCPNDRSTLSL
jgi:ribosomal protein L37E